MSKDRHPFRRNHWDSAEVAWAAGLFEGEGSITFPATGRVGGKKWTYPRLEIGMTDLDPLVRFNEIIGCGTIAGPYRSRGSRKDHYVWTKTGHEACQQAIVLMWPWLGVRRKARAAEVLARTGRFGAFR